MYRVGPREWASLQTIILIGRADGATVTADEISSYLDRSSSYTEVLLSKLKQCGFVGSNRGPRGGYILRVAPDILTVAEVMQELRLSDDVINDDVMPVVDALNESLKGITIESLL